MTDLTPIFPKLCRLAQPFFELPCPAVVRSAQRIHELLQETYPCDRTRFKNLLSQGVLNLVLNAAQCGIKNP